MLYTDPQYRIMGDRALLVELGDDVDPKINNRVRELFVAIKTDPLEGVVETTPSYRSLLLIFDPLKTTLSLLQDKVDHLLKTMDPSQLPEPRKVEIPVVYGSEYGPDLEWVAEYHGITPDEAIRLHTAPEGNPSNSSAPGISCPGTGTDRDILHPKPGRMADHRAHSFNTFRSRKVAPGPPGNG